MEDHVETDAIGTLLLGDGDKDQGLLNQKPHIKQKCMFTANKVSIVFFLLFFKMFQKKYLIQIQTNFNVTATPFISRQAHQWPAGVLPKENGGNTSNRIPMSAHYIPHQLSSISLPMLPVGIQRNDTKQTILFCLILANIRLPVSGSVDDSPQ